MSHERSARRALVSCGMGQSPAKRHALRDQGKVQQARELLAPVHGRLTEGFDTRDLKEAKTLLEELAL